MANVLVVAPHPDDEVLGCGGAIRRFVQSGDAVTVAIATKGTPLFPASQVRQVRSEARKAAAVLGVKKLLFLDLPVTTLHLIPEHKLNAVFSKLVVATKPDLALIPFPGDRHQDHREVFDAMMVAMRPDGRRHRVGRIACYETVSETHWSAPGIEPAFEPNWYVDISATLPDKLAAMREYGSQLAEAIPARSIAAIEALARFRGSVVGMPAAEAFWIVRDLL
ncbi:MAG: PIG-L deacetylase family protein [Phycisphaerae bacterium]|jgi:LmbE family N-acetylglucosaminyl deacetylase